MSRNAGNFILAIHVFIFFPGFLTYYQYESSYDYEIFNYGSESQLEDKVIIVWFHFWFSRKTRKDPLDWDL